MSSVVSSTGKQKAGSSTLVLALALALVLALTALVVEMQPIAPSESDPLHRDDHLAASGASRDSRVSLELYQRAVRSRDRGDIRVAKSLLKRALEAQPDNVDAMQMLGEIFYADRSYDHARTLFEHCLNARPDRMDSYANLAIVHLCQLDYDKADRVVGAGLAAVPAEQHGTLHLILACVREGQGRHGEELEHLRLAREALGDEFTVLLKSRWMQPLHESPEFQAMVSDQTGSANP